jgi:hypothetical protein
MDARAHKYLSETLEKVGEVFGADVETMWKVLEKFESFDSLLIYLLSCKYENFDPKKALEIVDSMPIETFTLKMYLGDGSKQGGEVIRFNKERERRTG